MSYERHGPAAVVGRPLTAQPQPRGVLGALAEETIEDLVRIVDELDADMGAIMPRYLARLHGLELPTVVSSPELSEPLARGSMAAFRDILTRLRTQAGPPTELPAEIATLTRAWGRAGGDLGSLTGLLTQARACLWEEFERTAERVVSDGEARWRVLKESHGLAAGYPAALAQLTQELFEAERRTAFVRAQANRGELVERLLAGHAISSEELGYDLAQEHIAVIAWGAGAQARLAALAVHLHRTALIVAGPEETVWGWLGSQGPSADGSMRALVAWQREQGGNLAFGEPQAGIEGFRASRKQALAAHTVALATDQHVARYDDVALLALICRDPAAVSDFVHGQLGELAEPDERHTRLRQTLRVYLEHGHSIKRAAAILTLHSETVRRHLDAAEQCLCHPIDERSAEVLVALRLTAFAHRTEGARRGHQPARRRLRQTAA
jgi:PucR C-terminal helix-turn-helix domain/GGDEF-like domain